MLKLRQHRHISIPRFARSAGQLVLSPVRSEPDDLIQAIEQDNAADNWHLDENPDIVGLEEYWTNVEQDLKKDPDWFDFAKD